MSGGKSAHSHFDSEVVCSGPPDPAPTDLDLTTSSAFIERLITGVDHKRAEPDIVPDLELAGEIRSLTWKAQEAWRDSFTSNSFTNFWLVDYLMYKCDITYRSLWKDPNILRGKFTAPFFNNRTAIEFLELFSKPGRCTSFCLQACMELARSSGFDYQYHDIGHHRIARCANTGLTLDSSSGRGVFALPEGQRVAHSGDLRQPEYYYESGILESTSTDHQNRRIKKRSSGGLSAAEAMIQSLLDTAKQAKLQPLCLFRSCNWETFKTTYHGMIKWCLKDRELWLIQDQNDPKNEKKATRFVWNEEDNFREHSMKYSTVLTKFIYFYGGPNGAKQWRGCSNIFRCIWIEACVLWGFPRVEGASVAISAPPDTNPDSDWTRLSEAVKFAIGFVFLGREAIVDGVPNFIWDSSWGWCTEPDTQARMITEPPFQRWFQEAGEFRRKLGELAAGSNDDIAFL